jgi:hypothetical protein
MEDSLLPRSSWALSRAAAVCRVPFLQSAPYADRAHAQPQPQYAVHGAGDGIETEVIDIGFRLGFSSQGGFTRFLAANGGQTEWVVSHFDGGSVRRDVALESEQPGGWGASSRA